MAWKKVFMGFTLKRPAWSILITALALGACASAPEPGSGNLAVEVSRVIPVGFEETWQAVKHVLREQGFAVFTRDKRGVFVAYTEEKRRRVQPWRTQLTVNLKASTSASTRVTVEAQRQKYGVTLLTYPGWHNRPTTTNEEAESFLQAVESKLTTTTEA